MKRWVFWGVGAVSVVAFIAVAILYLAARSTLAEDLQQAEEIIKADKDIVSVQDIHYYYGDEVIYTGEAVNENGTPLWVFVRDNKIVNTLNKDESITFKEAAQQVKETFNLNELRSIKPGIEYEEMIYEITFEKNDRLHFYYITMTDGTFIKRYSVKKT